MTKKTDPFTLIFFFLAVATLVFFMAPAQAGKEHHNADVDVSSVVSSSDRAFGIGGGDIDINDGYRSYSYLFGLVQETRSNPLEVARQLMAEGNYEAAAYLRCQPWGIYRAYGGKNECIAMLSKVPAVIVVPDVVDDFDEDEDEYREMQQAYEENLAEFEGRVARLESRKQVTRQVIQQPYLSDEKKAALREVVK